MADLSFVNTREFSRLIAKPSTLTFFDMMMIEELVELYPFSFPLHVSYAYALKKYKPEKFDDYLSKAAIYVPDRKLLFNIINNISAFEDGTTLSESAEVEEAIEEENIGIAAPAEELRDPEHLHDSVEEIPVIGVVPVDDEVFEETLKEDKAESENVLAEESEIADSEIEKPQLELPADFAVEESVVSNFEEETQGGTSHSDNLTDLGAIEIPSEEFEAAVDNIEREFDHVVTDAQFTESEAEDGTGVEAEQVNLAKVDTSSETPEQENAPAEVSIDEEASAASEGENPQAELETVYGLPISELPTEVLPIPSHPTFENTIETVIPDFDHPYFGADFGDTVDSDSAEPSVEVTPAPVVQEISDDRTSESEEIIGSVASTDYFVFDNSVADPLKEEEDPSAQLAAEPKQELVGKETVTRYDDDKMPFSFLWWLNKTRKEHADTYQPYSSSAPTQHAVANPAPKASRALDHQIIENIFHIQPEINVFKDEIETPMSFGIKRKEDEIIEKFIKEEPQIRPPKPDKLDTENKARKSSEDNLDLVSETLAKIYTDQMLYHKAIDTYQKLSLKFPEKSAYFDARISEIEKKVN